MQPIADIFRDYIANDKLLEAINLLREFFKGKKLPVVDTVFFLQSRYKKYHNDELGKMKSDEYLAMERQQIVQAMLALANEIEAEQPQTEPEPDNQYELTAIVAAIYANVHGMIVEDLELTMSTLHPENPGFAGTRELIQQIFGHYDLRYEIRDIQLLQYAPDLAVVQVVQRTIKASGPDFIDNEVIVLHTLKKDDRAWKIYGSAAKQITAL
ncbi:MAG: hypothetical protein SH848_17270 [Saprospiraceae bacterium]|nr:hypothetical protein [Saprospiraceae bacterium]MDZ4705681.1 hypothetical protein [Saprospiraceae bacterium]